MSAPATWAPVDLAPILAGIESGEITGPRPSLLARTDGVKLLYAGELHSLAGEPESGKGWLALSEVARLIEVGACVLYIDFEDSATNVTGRLLALGAGPQAILERFVYVSPADALTDGALKRLLAGQAFALAVLDGMSEAYALLGLNAESNADVPLFLSRLPRPIAATGAAVLLIDHVTKSKEGRGRWAIGAQHKLAGIAVAYGVEAIEQPSRLSTGRLKILVSKDRHGHVRGHAQGGVIALATIEPLDEGERVTVTIDLPDNASAEGDFRPTLLMERTSRAIEETPGITARELREHVKGSRATFKDQALQVLVAEGFVEVRADGRSRRHYSLAAYRQEGDCVPVSERVPSVSDTAQSERVPCPTPYGGDTRTRHANGAAESADVSRAMRFPEVG